MKISSAECKPLAMSFYNGTLDREKAVEFIESTNKEIKYRYGLGFRGAKKVDASRDFVIEKIMKKGSLLDVDEYDTEVIVNEYSSNDLL